MSINSAGLDGIARASAAAPSATPAAAPGAAAAAPPTTTVDTAFNVLFGYIPTEVITLYVAVLAALHQAEGVTAGKWIAFWSFFVATPLVVWLTFGAKVKALQKPLPLTPGAWPAWEMFAATMAYCAWALALPNAPFTEYRWYSSGLAAVAVLVASTVLGLLAPFFQHPLKV